MGRSAPCMHRVEQALHQVAHIAAVWLLMCRARHMRRVVRLVVCAVLIFAFPVVAMVAAVLVAAVLPQVRAFLDSLAPGAVVADVGCGNGKYLGVRQDLAVLGSDRSTGGWGVCWCAGKEGGGGGLSLGRGVLWHAWVRWQ